MRDGLCLHALALSPQLASLCQRFSPLSGHRRQRPVNLPCFSGQQNCSHAFLFAPILIFLSSSEFAVSGTVNPRLGRRSLGSGFFPVLRVAPLGEHRLGIALSFLVDPVSRLSALLQPIESPFGSFRSRPSKCLRKRVGTRPRPADIVHMHGCPCFRSERQLVDSAN